MAGDDDDFGALYGDAGQPVQEALPSAGTAEAAAPAAIDDDDALFMQLYGGHAPAEEPKTKIEPVVAIQAKVEAEAAVPGLGDVNGGYKQAAASQGAASPPPSEDEDDLMITLDENATAYEPSNRYQYQRPGADAGGTADAIGAAPGQHMDDAMPSIPGLGGHSARTAIGGVPRSAIPGLALSFAATAPPQPAAAAPSYAPHPSQGGPPGAGHLAARPAPRPAFRIEDAVFPSQQAPGLPVKLPGQTRVSPEEYREFLALGHGEVFELDIDAVVDAPWRFPGTDPGDFFNYGFNERTWKQYTDRVKQFRMEYTLRNQIQTLDQARYGPGAQHQAPQQQRRWGEEGGAGGDAGDQGVLAVGSESRDEHYESFVTSERPPRVQFPRYGNSWDHVIVLTGHDLNFEGADAEDAREAAMLGGAGGGGGGLPMRQAPHPRPAAVQHPRPPPPPKHPYPPTGPRGGDRLQQSSRQPPSSGPGRGDTQQGGPGASGLPGGMVLPPPFVGGGFPMQQGMGGMQMALPPPFRGAQDGPGMAGGPPGRRPASGGYDREPPAREHYGNGGAAGLAGGMDVEIPRRGGPPDRRGPGPPAHFDRGSRPPPRDFGGPPPFRDRGAPPTRFERGGPPPFRGPPRPDFGEQVRQRMRSRSPVRDRRGSPPPRWERERGGRDPRDTRRERSSERRRSRTRSPRRKEEGGRRERERDRR